MKITQALLDELTAKAKANPRLRMNMDLRNSDKDQSQRMLNAIEPGSPLPIHRHRKTSETVVCLRGRLVEEYYDELERRCTETIELSPNGPVVALNIPAGQWHTVRVLESGTVIMEVKEGPYEPLSDVDVLQMEEGRSIKEEVVERLKSFMENEARSCSMDFGCITPQYIYRMWGGAVPLEEIGSTLKELRQAMFNYKK